MINPYIFLAPSILFGGIGSIFLKRGAMKLNFSLQILKNFELFLGLSLFGLSMILYIPALKYGDLSTVYPLSSITYIVVAVLSAAFLKEKLTFFKILGIIFIICGCFLVVK